MGWTSAGCGQPIPIKGMVSFLLPRNLNPLMFSLTGCNMGIFLRDGKLIIYVETEFV